MSVWIWSGEMAVLFGTGVFVLLFAPAVAVQYRRLGRLSAVRMVGTFAICLYATALVTYTMLPLPAPGSLTCKTRILPQLIPFRMFSDIAKAAPKYPSLIRLLTGVEVLQVVFNVLLFVPLGILVRQYFGKSVGKAVTLGFAVSLLIETTQGTAVWGLYPCPYRYADVDDLIANTTGALVGALVAPAVLWWLPNQRVLAAHRLDPRPVTSSRRWWGQVVDGGVLNLLVGAAWLLVEVAALVLGWPRNGPLVKGLSVAAAAVVWFLMFLLPPWSNLGASMGQSAVWLTPVWRDRTGRLSHGGLPRRLTRANLIAVPYLVWLVWERLSLAAPLPLGLLCLVLVVLSPLLVPFTETHRSLSGWATGAEFVDIRTLVHDPAARSDLLGLPPSEPSDPAPALTARSQGETPM